MHFKAFSRGQCTERGYFFGLLRFQIIFLVCLIFQFFLGKIVDARPKSTYEENMRVPTRDGTHLRFTVSRNACYPKIHFQQWK